MLFRRECLLIGDVFWRVPQAMVQKRLTDLARAMDLPEVRRGGRPWHNHQALQAWQQPTFRRCGMAAAPHRGRQPPREPSTHARCLKRRCKTIGCDITSRRSPTLGERGRLTSACVAERGYAEALCSSAAGRRATGKSIPVRASRLTRRPSGLPSLPGCVGCAPCEGFARFVVRSTTCALESSCRSG